MLNLLLIFMDRFYRCVKFNQQVENYSVFEFDCPAGLAFDESTDVCVWPGSLSKSSPCPGSPEIAPSTPRRFSCPKEGYYADPENCQWFFACMDLGNKFFLNNSFKRDQDTAVHLSRQFFFFNLFYRK